MSYRKERLKWTMYKNYQWLKNASIKLNLLQGPFQPKHFMILMQGNACIMTVLSEYAKGCLEDGEEEINLDYDMGKGVGSGFLEKATEILGLGFKGCIGFK